MATFRKRNNKWQAQVRYKGYPNLTRTFSYKADAVEWATETERQIQRRGLPTNPKMLEGSTVSDLVRRYRDEIVPLKRGRVVETIILNAFLRAPVAKLCLSDLNPAAFAAYRDERLKAVRPATINRELGLVQHVFEIAQREWNIGFPSNPLKAVRKPKPDQGRQRRLQNGDWQRLMDACQRCRNPLIRPLMAFAVETGMRRGELLNARWADVNWIDHTLKISISKNGHPRTIPLTSNALTVLASLGNIHRGDDRLLPLTIESVKLAWKRLVKRARIEDLHFHDLRHEAVSRFFELGLTVPEVALISGHRDPRMLFRYTHLKAGDVGKRIGHLLLNGR
jgi:integrase